MIKPVILVILVTTLLLTGCSINHRGEEEFSSVFKGEGEHWYAEIKIKKDKIIAERGTEWTECQLKIKYKKEDVEELSLHKICYGYEWELKDTKQLIKETIKIKGGPKRTKISHQECTTAISELLNQKEYTSISHKSNLNVSYRSDVIKVIIIWDDNEESFEIEKIK